MSGAGSKLRGSCLCGACKFDATPTEMSAGACHCGMCRKWAGGILLTTGCDSVVFDEGAPVGSFKASEWGERIFCKECGSSLVWQTQDKHMQYVSIQAFDDPSQFEMKIQVFYDQKPDNYELANKTATMTEAEIFAMFAPGDGA